MRFVPFTDELAEELIELIDAGALEGEVNRYAPYDDYPVGWGTPLLATMASLGRQDVVAALLRAGADPNLSSVRESDEERHPPIVLADDPSIMRMLLAAGADVNARATHGQTALHRAASWGDEDMVRDLLAAGADPMVAGSEAGAPIQQRIEGRYPQRPSIQRLLREAAAPKLAALKGSSVTGWRRRKGMYTIGRDFGARDIERESLDAGQKWTVIAVAQPCEIAAARLAESLDACRWEQEAHKRYILDALKFIPVFALKNSRWSLVLADDLGLDGASAAARDLSEALGSETILVFCELVKRYADGFAVEEHDWSEENIGSQFDPDEDQDAYDDECRRLQDEYHAWLTKHEILIPTYELVSTGHICGATLYGIRKRDVTRGDVIVLEEHP